MVIFWYEIIMIYIEHYNNICINKTQKNKQSSNYKLIVQTTWTNSN